MGLSRYKLKEELRAVTARYKVQDHWVSIGRDHYWYMDNERAITLCWCAKKKYKVTTNHILRRHFYITATNINDAKIIAIVRFKLMDPNDR